MRKYIFVLICLFLFSSLIHSQNIISASAGYGQYLYNSENSLPIMGDKKIISYFTLGIAYQRNNLWGYNFILEYNYHQRTKHNTIEFAYIDWEWLEIAGFKGVNVSLVNHTFDLAYTESLNDNFSYGVGPSFVITNRALELDSRPYRDYRFYDKLASSGIGVNAFISASIPLNADNNWLFISKVKVRYTHSIWFDEGIRKLDDYNQDFLSAEVKLGIGYSF